MRNNKRQSIQGPGTIQWRIGCVLAACENHKVMGWDRDICIAYIPTKQTLIEAFIETSSINTTDAIRNL